MVRRIIQVPTIKDDDSGYKRILKIANIIFENPRQQFDFSFSGCSKIEHNSVVVLGALARYVDYHNTLQGRLMAELLNTNVSAGVMFLVDTMTSPVSNHMIGNNFLSYFSRGDFRYPAGGYIGYREHNNRLDADNIAAHLHEQWLSADKLKLSTLLKEAIVSRIFEIFMNAYGHGVLVQNINKLGVYSCGQYDQKNKKLDISVLDFGPGIVENVKGAKSEIVDSVEAMKWALIKGNSTRTDSKGSDMPRGLGFELLLEFVRINDGEMRIYSNDVRVLSSKLTGVRIEKSEPYLPGTLVSIKINCDDREYRFLSENNSTQEQYF